MRHLASDPFRAPRPEPVSLLYDRPRAELHIRDRCGALVAVIGDHGIQSADEWKAMVDDERSDRDLANTYVIAHPQPPQICERSAEEERILALAGCADDSADDEASDADA